jgi:3-deoxy-D-manno-octulosonate 8-phosphate phosphatase (KDO 8-P phosphatase)
MNVSEKAAKIKLLLMDVDGVMTDGKLFNVPAPDGSMAETKGFSAQDGIALQWLSWFDIKKGLISGRNSPATVERAKQCKFTHVYQGFIEKIPILEQILKAEGISSEQVAFIGDDFTDVVLFRRVGLSVATGNARPEVKKCADYVTTAVGGDGAVREVCELLLRSQGYWEQILKKYEIE